MDAKEIFGDLIEQVSIGNTQDEARQEMEQKSIEWFLHRWDKFTGSRSGNLLKSGRGKGEEWGETAKKEILNILAYHRMTDEGREKQALLELQKDFYQTRWGNQNEPIARDAYRLKTGCVVNETGFTIHPKIPYMGGSFDGKVQSGAEIAPFDGIIEIKCPYDPIKHQQNYDLMLSGGIDISHEYYSQIQHNIEVAGVEWCDFISFDPRCKAEYQLVIIRVERDQIFIDALLTRIHKAKRILDGLIVGRPMVEMIREVEQ